MSDHKTATDRLIAALAEIRDAITAQTEAIEEQTCAMWADGEACEGGEARPRPRNVSAHIADDAYCADCGWPIVDACCNDQFKEFKDAAEHDWWYYCTNKGCKNHDGEGAGGVFERPSWVRQERKAIGDA